MKKEKILKIIFIVILAIVPILFFTYAGYTSIMALAAEISTNKNSLIIATRNAFNLFISYTEEYLVYTLLMFLNYILYKKKCSKTLLIINSIFLIILIIDIISTIFYHLYNYDLLLFLINALIGLTLGIKLSTKK